MTLKPSVEIFITYFRISVKIYNEKLVERRIELRFERLSGGYGEHLFNEIARNIIGADVAVFETSDLNPNVMIEMGVALTWGIRVLPIRRKDAPNPPSDISGQTWVEYEDNAAKIIDGTFNKKLAKMIERAIGVKKRNP